MNITAPVSVERTIAAPATAVFAVLADPSRHREIDGSGTVRDASEGSRQVELGDVFGMNMRVGVGYRMANEVVELEPGRRIAWQARSSYDLLRHAVGGRIWRYELEPVDGGTLVRETWDISQEAIPLLVAPMRGLTRRNMARTLERLEQVVTR